MLMPIVKFANYFCMQSLLVGLLTALPISTLHAQEQFSEPRQISGAQTIFGDVINYQISPDARRVVYIADQIVNGKFELFSVSINGGTVVKLNADLASDGRVTRAEITPDSNFVIYLSTGSNSNTLELYRVPITGGAPIRLNADLANGGEVSSFRISSDNRHVVYLADQLEAGVDELFSVPISGGTPTRLSINLIEDRVIDSYMISGDGQRLVYLTRLLFRGYLLYSVPITGGSAIPLNSALATRSSVFQFKISPNSQRVVYLSSEETTSGRSELFSVPIAGGTPIRLNANLVNGGNVSFSKFEISPNSQRVVYIADQDIDDVNQLYSVPLEGGTSIRINGNVLLSGDVRSFRISSDSQRVVYEASDAVNTSVELFSVPISSRLPSPLTVGALQNNLSISQYLISENSQHVVYELFDPSSSSTSSTMIFSESITGGQPVTLSSDVRPSVLRISADSERVIFLGDNAQRVTELFSVPLTGGEISRLNTPLPFNADVDGFDISSDGKRIVYLADQDVFDELELFSVRLISPDSEQFCIPIKTSNNKVVVVCI